MLVGLPLFFSNHQRLKYTGNMGTFSVRKTTEQFIAEAKAVHGDKYDYSKVEYVNTHTKVCIICPKHGEFWQEAKSHLQGRGCFKCFLCSKHKYGVAICDIPNSCQEDYYMAWRSMLERALGDKYKKKYPTYKDCSVCEEWLTLSNFKKWFEDPKNGYRDGFHLDKDILIKGNKVYSPDTCCFVPHEINTMFSRKSSGDLPVGVNRCGGLFTATVCINYRKHHLGCYPTAEEAFNAYKDAKERHIKSIAEKYFQEGKITKKVYDALMKYEVEITD